MSITKHKMKLQYLAEALSNWDNEGGATKPPKKPPEYLNNYLPKNEGRVLRRLGVAVMLLWNDLPTKIQRNLFFSASTVGKNEHLFKLKQQIAILIHNHKNGA